MDLLNSKYIILEIIPTSLKRETGEVVQLSALKLDGIKLIDRFDYRLVEEKVPIHDFIDMCSYDISNVKESIFHYLDILNDDKAIDNMISKYHLEPSNYIVDLLYEALIHEL